METIHCPWKPIRLIWIWDWGLLLSSLTSYDLLVALFLHSPISLISLCSSLSLSPSVVRYSTLSLKQIFPWWMGSVEKLCQIFMPEAGSSPGDTCDIKRWKLKEGLQSVSLSSFSMLRARCVLAMQRPVSHGNTAASTCPPRLSLLLFPLCINATVSLVLQHVCSLTGIFASSLTSST